MDTNTSTKLRLAILISGRGSNMAALMDAIEEHSWPIEIGVVVSNKSKAPGLELAKARDIPTAVVPRKSKEKSVSEFNLALVSAIQPYAPDLIVLAGFMCIVSKEFIHAFPNKVINIHPSLLPSFRGLHAQRQALDAGVKFSGCTVHYVVEEVDAGPILGQAVVPVFPSDTEDSLATRILKQEHKLLPAVVHALALSDQKEREEELIGFSDLDSLISVAQEK